MELAPIILFVYNRPQHTKKTLEALMNNELASESHLYIFADGLKKNHNENDRILISQTRKLLFTKQWCRKVTIIEKEVNSGCASSIVNGVTEVINIHGKVIVLEDDICTSPYFLRYMNEGLHLFENRMDIGSINGFAVDFLVKNKFPRYFLLNNADCWGWSTWKNRWDNFNFDAKQVKEQIIAANKENIFEYGGHMSLLDLQIEGQIDMWDVQWHACNILYNQKGVFAKYPFIINIGQDGSGTHYSVETKSEQPIIELNNYSETLTDFTAKHRLLFSEKVEKKFRKLYMKNFKTSLFERGVKKIKRTLNSIFKLY